MTSSFRFRRAECSPGVRTRYAVAIGDRHIGYVFSRRVESWRTLPSGVRYSLRGRPVQWGYESLRGPSWERESSAIYSSRDDAASTLAERAKAPERS